MTDTDTTAQLAEALDAEGLTHDDVRRAVYALGLYNREAPGRSSTERVAASLERALGRMVSTPVGA